MSHRHQCTNCVMTGSESQLSTSIDEPGRALQTFYLISEPGGVEDGMSAKLRAVEVPRELRYLHVGTAGIPELNKEAARPGVGVAIQAIDTGSQLALLVLRLVREASAPRVNGSPLAPLSLLRSGDQMLIDGQLLHIATYCRPPIAPASQDHVGKECPLCRGPVDSGDLVYVCPCGWGPVHCKSAVKASGEQALECVTLLRECTACKHPLILDERWEHVPTVE